jgi:hypothetical protein
LLVYNNTLYNCGSRALLGNIGSGAGGIIAVSGAAANLYLVASNNVIFSANGAEPYTQNSSNRFCTAATAYCPSASLNNVLYGLGTAAPKFLADSILTNPEFRAAPSDFYLPIANPAAGASTAGLTSLKDFDGIVRNSANPTPGAFEYVPSLPSSSRPLGATTTTITPSANPQNYGSRLVFTIYVSSAGSSTAVPSGPVLVYDGSVLLAPVTLDGSGYASFAVYALTPGTHTIKASYSGNAIFAASNGNLTETINGPIAAVSTKAWSFSSPLKITSASQTITLSNIGTSALTIRSVSAGAPYSQSNNCFPAGSPASLAANASCTIQVTYHPTSTAALAQKASLMINLATPGISQLVALTGSLVAPTFTLSAPSLSAGAMSYGYQMVGSYSNFQTVTVTNTSPLANLTITGISISNWGLSTDACTPFPATLGPGGTCTLALAFRPLTPGAKLGQIKANVANPGTSQSITLNGTGISPISTMPLRNLSFGRVTRGTTRTMTLTVINPANDPQLNGLSVSFSGNSDFSQSTTSPGTCGTTLPGATSIQRCTINVVFAPGSGEGQNSTDAGAVTISGLEGPLPQSVTVSLTGIAY